jgi:hypothetical protein
MVTPDPQLQAILERIDALTTAVTRLTAQMLPGERLPVGTPLDQAQALIDSGMEVTEAYRQAGVIKSQRRRKPARTAKP